MNDLIQVIGIALIAVVIVTVLKKEKPEIALQIGLVAGIVIFLFMFGKLTLVLETVQMISNKLNVSPTYFNIILKIVAITYLASTGIEMCRDADQHAIASKIEFAAKITIIVIAIPLILTLTEMVQLLLNKV